MPVSIPYLFHQSGCQVGRCWAGGLKVITLATATTTAIATLCARLHPKVPRICNRSIPFAGDRALGYHSAPGPLILGADGLWGTQAVGQVR